MKQLLDYTWVVINQLLGWVKVLSDKYSDAELFSQKIDSALILSNVTTETSLTNLSIENYSIAVTLSNVSALSFVSTPNEGWECMIDIKNTGSSTITLPLPNAAGWQCDEASIGIAAGKIASISVRRIHGTYVVLTKGN